MERKDVRKGWKERRDDDKEKVEGGTKKGQKKEERQRRRTARLKMYKGLGMKSSLLPNVHKQIDSRTCTLDSDTLQKWLNHSLHGLGGAR